LRERYRKTATTRTAAATHHRKTRYVLMLYPGLLFAFARRSVWFARSSGCYPSFPSRTRSTFTRLGLRRITTFVIGSDP
jgi:hypothetical protein